MTEHIVPPVFDSRPGAWNRELRDARYRIEALEQAIREAHECLADAEGVSLAYHMESDAESRALILEVLGEDE